MEAANNDRAVGLQCIRIVPSSAVENKHPILYVHTIGHCKELWPRGALTHIAESTNRKSFVLDVRCHGDSPHTDEFSPDLIVEDLLLFLRSNNIAKAILVGHGLGGIAVSLFALRHPGKVEMMVNVEGTLSQTVLRTMHRDTITNLDTWAESVRNAPRDMPIEDVVRRAYDEVYAHFPLLDGSEPREGFYNYTHPIRLVDEGYDVKHNLPAISAYLNRSANGEESLDLSGTFEGPALFLMASNSHAKEGLDLLINGKFLKQRIEVVEATHHMHLLFPQLFEEKFLAFYNQHDTKF